MTDIDAFDLAMNALRQLRAYQQSPMVRATITKAIEIIEKHADKLREDSTEDE